MKWHAWASAASNPEADAAQVERLLRERLAGVLAVQRERLDRTYLRRWAAEIGVVDTLQDALAGRFKPKQT